MEKKEDEKSINLQREFLNRAKSKIYQKPLLLTRFELFLSLNSLNLFTTVYRLSIYLNSGAE